MDDLLEGLLAEETTGDEPAQPDSPTAAQRERLATIAAGGQARKLLGKHLTVEEIDSLGEDEIGKLYARYEARLGTIMTKTLGRAALQLYTAVASLLLPIPPESRLPLMDDFESDPFVGHELYYRYGKLLAPITAALTTLKYCQIGHQCPRRIEEDGCDDDTHAGGAAGAGDNCGATSVEGDGRDSAEPVA